MLLESLGDFRESYDSVSCTVANQITVYPKTVALLLQAARDPRPLPAIVTSGVRQVRKIVPQQIKLPRVPVFGGGRVSDQYVVTPQTKARIVEQFATRNTRVGRRTATVYGNGSSDIL